MELDIGQIMEILPHRQPFLLIDAVEELEPGKRAVARKWVHIGDVLLKDIAGTGVDLIATKEVLS